VRTIPAGFLDSHVTQLHVCWRVIRRDGEVIYGTECDEDITITTGDYVGVYIARAGITGSDIRSTSDLSVDNLEVVGALAPSAVPGDTGDTSDTSDTGTLTLIDVSAADIEAGLLDNAEAVTFIVNSDDPDLYQRVLRAGWIGNVTRTAEGKWTTELRGLTQALSQGIVRTYGVGCDAELFDARCRVDPAAFSLSSYVYELDSRRRFKVHPDLGDLGAQPGQVPGGMITWTSGANTGYSMEIKTYSDGAPDTLDNLFWVELFLPMPRDIDFGDTFDFRAGCDKKMETCLGVYSNLPNFRGHGVLVPGDAEILKVGKK
jgi:uncharacterized phage protein (TIGR02218 family)